MLSTHHRLGHAEAATLTAALATSASQALFERPIVAEGANVAQAPIVRTDSREPSRAKLVWSFEKDSVCFLAKVSPNTRDTMAANVRNDVKNTSCRGHLSSVG